jgi:hypothetical protein
MDTRDVKYSHYSGFNSRMLGSSDTGKEGKERTFLVVDKMHISMDTAE